MSNYQDKNNNLDEENELQLIIGRNPVIEALKANKLIDTIYINPEAKGSITLICRLAKEKGINVKRVTETKLNNMSRGASHQGVIAMVRVRSMCLRRIFSALHMKRERILSLSFAMR